MVLNKKHCGKKCKAHQLVWFYLGKKLDLYLYLYLKLICWTFFFSISYKKCLLLKAAKKKSWMVCLQKERNYLVCYSLVNKCLWDISMCLLSSGKTWGEKKTRLLHFAYVTPWEDKLYLARLRSISAQCDKLFA